MVIKIPADVEEAVKERASSGGFSDVDEYVLHLVQQDQELRRCEECEAQDPRIEALALEGLASGPAVPLDMHALRQSFCERCKATDGQG